MVGCVFFSWWYGGWVIFWGRNVVGWFSFLGEGDWWSGGLEGDGLVVGWFWGEVDGSGGSSRCLAT